MVLLRGVRIVINEVMRYLYLLALVVFGISIFCISETHMEMACCIQNYCVGAFLIFTLMLFVLSLCLGYSIIIPKEKILETICFFGILEIIYALLQPLGFLPNNYRYAYFSGSLNNPAIFGMFLSFCLPISIYLSMRRQGKKKTLWRVLCITFAIFVLLSDSRTAVIASFCGMSAVLIMMNKEKFINFWKKKHAIYAIVICIIFSSVVLYYYKRDSADGRLLIWNVCLEMIKDKPLFGWGFDGYIAQYMNYQADFLTLHPDSSFTLLADETRNPFNEFIHVAVICGIPAALLFIGILVGTLWYMSYKQIEFYEIQFSLILVFIVWCLFGYPLNIPFVWLLILFIVLSIIPLDIHLSFRRVGGTIALIVGILCSSLLIKSGWYNLRRISLQEYAINDTEEQILDRYECMYKDYTDDGLFLYNYAAVLHLYGEYEKSISIFKECSNYINDYNMMLLMGDDYQQMDLPDSAIICYNRANEMIPNRYLPLYYQMKIYQEQNDDINAKVIAKAIIHKENKIKKSETIKEIIKRANNCLEGIEDE